MKITLCFLALSVCFLVGETDAALCKDDRRYNCKYLDKHFGVCSNHTRNPKVTASCPKTCNLCLVDGGWSDWSDWSSCNVTCDIGIQTRTRQCDNPAPVNGGLACEGDNIETQRCDLDACTVHGGWDDWSAWESCSVTCGGGLKKRRRTCTNPAPSSFGRQCAGNDEDKDRCNDFACEGNGVAFLAYNGRLAPAPNGGTVIFPKVRVGESFYNKANGVFTAPVAGMYTFTAIVCDQKGLILHIRINNFNFAKGRVYTSSDIQCSSATGTTKLNKGDKVTVVTDAKVVYDSGTYFTGHLIHSYE